MASDLIPRLDRWLATNRADYYAKLRPGATPKALKAFDSRFAVKLPSEFRELYQWRNGQADNASLQYNLMFSSLEEIADTKEMLDGMIGSDFEDPKWWRRGWVPFLANGGGDHWCVDLTAEDGGVPGQVLVFYHDEAYRGIRFPSLDAWLRNLVESMENGSLELS